jgi:hypothetical protein
MLLTVRNTKQVCYFSAEFLVGPLLMQHLINLNLVDEFRQAVEFSATISIRWSIRRKSRASATAASAPGRVLSRVAGDSRFSGDRLRPAL